MFSKPILKQTLKGNYKLWLIFTAILCVMSAVTISVFDPKMISSMMEMFKDLPIAESFGDQLSGFTSLLGMLSQQFYGMLAVILPMIFIIITANSLIASQVDRGSMAYLLSTPTKRSTVVRTQAAYLIGSVFCMFLVVTIVGLSSVQLVHKGLWGEKFTPDVTAASEILDVDKSDLTNDLSLILGNEEALKAGAEARDIEQDVYVVYLNQKMTNNAYQAAADILDKDVEEVTKNLSLITENSDALNAAAKVMGVDAEIYRTQLEAAIAQQEAAAGQSSAMQEKIISGMTAAAEVLGLEPADLMDDMSKIKANKAALTAAATTSELPEEVFLAMINGQLAADELALDEGIDFNAKDYLMLNLGAFLLMFAISAISFLFSCVFNLTKNSLAFGAGIPIAFFIFQIMSQIGDSLSGFKYLSLNTLYDTNAIVNGGSYGMKFAILAVIGVVLYAVGMNSFQKKDLPL
jgi:ABC-2 type transport system permease protein